MIKVSNLTKCFDGLETNAVDRISFEVGNGQIAAIIGTSGCGKTTTLKMLNRLIEPTSGQIWIDKELATQSDPIAWRRKIGYVIQKAGLLPHLTVEDNISLLSTILDRKRDWIHKRVKELMELVDMSYAEFSSRYPVELSGGQQQRIGIARALMENPPVMLMDEPFGALDPITRNSLHDEFVSLNQKLHKTIIMVTHDMEEAFKLADSIIIMNEGRIVQQGSKDDLLNNPAGEFVTQFLQGHLNA